MAISTLISQKELERVAALAYEGETLKVMLCNVGATSYTAESTVANWQSVELSGNGYARFSQLVTVGSYDATDARYEIPAIDAAFSATSAGYSYDRIVIYIDGSTYVHSVISEDPNIALSAGQTQTYRIQLCTDD
jgi:hypothetical protein